MPGRNHETQVHTLGGFSAHAGQKDLLAWFDGLASSRPRVIIIHGEDGPRQALAKLIGQKYHLKTEPPQMKETLVI